MSKVLIIRRLLSRNKKKSGTICSKKGKNALKTTSVIQKCSQIIRIISRNWILVSNLEGLHLLQGTVVDKKRVQD